jgi:hypothetical protein
VLPLLFPSIGLRILDRSAYIGDFKAFDLVELS